MTATIDRYLKRAEPRPTLDALLRHALTGGREGVLTAYLAARPRLRESLNQLVAGVRADFQAIRFAAYLKFEARNRRNWGAVHGHDVDDWLEAELELCRKTPAAVAARVA